MGRFCFGHGYDIDTEFTQFEGYFKVVSSVTCAVKLINIVHPKADVYAVEESVYFTEFVSLIS